MASLPVNFTWPGTEVRVMLGGEERGAVVLGRPPDTTQPVSERLEKQVAAWEKHLCNQQELIHNTLPNTAYARDLFYVNIFHFNEKAYITNITYHISQHGGTRGWLSLDINLNSNKLLVLWSFPSTLWHWLWCCCSQCAAPSVSSSVECSPSPGMTPSEQSDSPSISSLLLISWRQSCSWISWPSIGHLYDSLEWQPGEVRWKF